MALRCRERAPSTTSIAALIWVGLATAKIVKSRECPLGAVIIDLGRGWPLRGRDISIRHDWAILLDAGRP